MANLVYLNEETATTFEPSGGDLAWTLTSLSSGAGRQSATLDFGVDARPGWYNWHFATKFATAPVVGEAVGLFLKRGDGTNWDNDDGEGDIAVSSVDKLRNLLPLGSVIVDEASTSAIIGKSGSLYIPWREIAIVAWNYTADDLSSTAGDHFFGLVPVTPEIQ